MSARPLLPWIEPKRGRTGTTQKVRWTEAEDQVLRENYSRMGSSVKELLPGRSVDAITRRACNLRLKSEVCRQYMARNPGVIRLEKRNDVWPRPRKQRILDRLVGLMIVVAMLTGCASQKAAFFNNCIAETGDADACLRAAEAFHDDRGV